MVKKEFSYRGKSLEELQGMSHNELAPLLCASARRKIKRGFSDEEKTFLKNVKESKKAVKTHCRDMLVLPEMVDKTISIHKGNKFVDVIITGDMIGHRLGEFSLSRGKVTHTVTGVGGKKGVARK